LLARFVLLPVRRPPGSPLFPYTTLFRSASPPSSTNASPPTAPGPSSNRSASRTAAERRTAVTSRRHTPAEPPAQWRIVCLVGVRSEEHTSELQSRENLVCRLLLEKKK